MQRVGKRDLACITTWGSEIHENAEEKEERSGVFSFSSLEKMVRGVTFNGM